MEGRDLEVVRADLFALHRHTRTLSNVCRDVLRATARMEDHIAGLADELGIQLEDTAERGTVDEHSSRNGQHDRRCVV